MRKFIKILNLSVYRLTELKKMNNKVSDQPEQNSALIEIYFEAKDKVESQTVIIQEIAGRLGEILNLPIKKVEERKSTEAIDMIGKISNILFSLQQNNEILSNCLGHIKRII